jgi:glutaredoxin
MPDAQTPGQSAMQSENGKAAGKAIVVYGAPWCPDCRRVKYFLKERSMEFEDVNIEESREAEELVLRVNHGRRRVPTLKVGDRYIACSPFNPLQLAKELQIPLNR